MSCGGNDRKKEIETEKGNYASGINSSHKALIRNILEKDTKLKKTTIPSKNKILVVEKSNREILPYTNINSILKDRGYNISYNSNDLDYIIVVKFEWTKSGMYSGGRDAHDCKTLIYAIDTKTDKINLIESRTIPAPEKVSERPRQDGYYGGIKYGGYKLADLIIDNALN
jgi:hypothetical protein